jgi:hypothetical protein
MRDQKGLSDETLGNPNWNIYGARPISEGCALKLSSCRTEARGTCEDEKEVCGVRVLVSMSSLIRVGWL